MFNTEDIIELEKKWFKYKVKQKSKLYVFIILTIVSLSSIVYTIYTEKEINIPTKSTIKKIDKQKEIKKEKPIKKTLPLIIDSNSSSNIKNTNTITVSTEANRSKKGIIIPPKVVIKNNNLKPYYFKLEPTNQGSELFSSSGFLTLNIKNKNHTVEPIKEIQINTLKVKEAKKQMQKISIDMQEVDTITYLKNKYYSTSSIVFALMLSEEYYYEKKYKESLKWSLTANDIDSQNTKSWYWFAKSKVKLGQKEDAIKALNAYLSNNSSKRLSTLLHKIELGETDD